MSFSRGVEERLRTPLPKTSPPRFTHPENSPTQTVMQSPKFSAVTNLDAQFSTLIHDIQSRLSLLARAPTIRVEKWVRKLHEPVHHTTWQRLRNDHARLLLYNLKRGVTNAPFDKAPGDGPLRNLDPNEKALIKRDGHGGVKGGRNLHEDAPNTEPHANPTKRNGHMLFGADVEDDVSPMDAEGALRDLLRRAEVAGAPKTFGSFSGVGNDDDTDENNDPSNNLSDISREMRAFIAGDGIDDGSGELNMASASVEDVRAELGASRELVKELQWRLRRSEHQLEKCNAELNETRLAAQAMRDLKTEELRELRASHRRELDQLIGGFEKRRAEREPRVNKALQTAGVDETRYFNAVLGGTSQTKYSYEPGFGSRVPTGRSPQRKGLHRHPSIPLTSYNKPEREKEFNEKKETDFFEYLESFQKKSAAMRRRINAEE